MLVTTSFNGVDALLLVSAYEVFCEVYNIGMRWIALVTSLFCYFVFLLLRLFGEAFLKICK